MRRGFPQRFGPRRHRWLPTPGKLRTGPSPLADRRSQASTAPGPWARKRTARGHPLAHMPQIPQKPRPTRSRLQWRRLTEVRPPRAASLLLAARVRRKPATTPGRPPLSPPCPPRPPRRRQVWMPPSTQAVPCSRATRIQPDPRPEEGRPTNLRRAHSPHHGARPAETATRGSKDLRLNRPPPPRPRRRRRKHLLHRSGRTRPGLDGLTATSQSIRR